MRIFFIALVILSFCKSFSSANAQTLSNISDTFGVNNISDTTLNTVNNALGYIDTSMNQVFSVLEFTNTDEIEHGFLIIGLDTEIGSFDRNALTSGPFLGENPITELERQKICSISTNAIGATAGAACSVGALIGAGIAGVATAEVGGVGAMIIIAACSAGSFAVSEYAEYGQEHMANCDDLDDGDYNSNGDPL